MSFSHTIPSEHRDFREWHRGRPHYAVWAVDAEVPAICARVAEAQARLGGALLDGYCRQPHVTVGLCGFPAVHEAESGNFTPARLARQVASLRAARIGPFTLDIGAAESFASAPYLAVADSARRLQALRHCLAAGGDDEIDRYQPHLTLGLYREAMPRHALTPLLTGGGEAPIRLSVTRLCWMAYATAEIGGPLQRVASFELATGEWHVAASETLPEDLRTFVGHVGDAR